MIKAAAAELHIIRVIISDEFCVFFIVQPFIVIIRKLCREDNSFASSWGCGTKP